jgi:DNA-binding NarL/FixJ family response regulator
MNVVICDDHRLFSDALAIVLGAREWTVVDCAIDPAHALAVIASEQVDTCLMDLMFPDGPTGIDGIRSIHATSPDTKVVVLTSTSDPNLIMKAVESGADGIVFKDDDISHIVAVVERVQRGEVVMHRARPKPAPVVTAAVSTHELGRFLTDRECEVLEHLVRGESGTELARSMGIAYSTARTHVQNVLAKLGVHSRLEAVAFAIEHELVSIPDEPFQPGVGDSGTRWSNAG